jgi:hypothetical protein
MSKYISVEGPISVASVVFNPEVGEALAPVGSFLGTTIEGHRYVIDSADLEDAIAAVTNNTPVTAAELLATKEPVGIDETPIVITETGVVEA